MQISKIKHRFLAAATLGAVLSVTASAQSPPKSDTPDAKADVAAYVGGQPITLQDVDAKALKTNMKLAQSLYDARRAALDQLVLERLLGPEAATKGKTVDQLVSDRIAEKVKAVTDAEVEAFYNANKARMGDKTLEQMSEQIRTQLRMQRDTSARTDLLTELKEKSQVRVVLAAPRVDVVVAANEPSHGPANAKVTIVEYSDFQ